jgi:hypothetical protein
LRDADEIVNGIKQNGIADGNFMAIPCFFFFSKSFISSTCRYITFTRPFIHVLQKKAPRKHPQYINKINDNANNSN